jgi:acyl-coenzyme A synthetase/AMP-(fatty) acid ligase
MFLGYITSGEAYTGYGANGFFMSADLVSVDDQGRLFHRGRADIKVKVGDHLVNPIVVEQVLLECAGVLNARCYAEPHPILGHTLVAEVVQAPGAELDVDVLREACRATLEPPLVPRTILVAEELATTVGGKRARSLL